MWIESLHIDKFGKLRGYDMRLERGLTLINGRNESGKSTVMAFVRAMLYGLNGKSAAISQNDRKKYMPWGETSMGGSLRLTDGATLWEISRVFGQRKRLDTCRVVDAATGEDVEIPAGDEVGRVLLGIDESVFADTLFVSARGSRLDGDGATLAEKMKNLIGTGAEDVDLGKVLDRLHSAKSVIAPRTRDRGSLADTTASITRVQQSILDGAAVQTQIRSLEKQVQALEKQESTSAQQQLMRARIMEKEQSTLRLERYQRKVDQLEAEIDALSSAPEAVHVKEKQPPAGPASRALPMLFIVLAVLSVVASIAAGLLISNYCYAGLLVTTALCVGYMRAKDKLELEQLQPQPQPQKTVPDDARRLTAAQRERAMYQQQSTALAQRIAAMQREIEHSATHSDGQQDQLVAARVQLETLRHKRGDIDALRRELAQLTLRAERLQASVSALEMAEDEIMEAARLRQSAFAPQLTEKLEQILSRVTKGKYAKAAVSQSLALSLQPEEGALQPWDYFSGGTVELMYLALRLALVDMLQKNSGALPVLLDDPLVLLDDERAGEALLVMKDFAQGGRQVLLFTCQQRSVQLSDGARVISMS